jgi:hypothetical protein
VRRCLAAIAVCIPGLATGLPPAVAAPLGKEECDKLQAEQTELTAAGVRAQFDRGPEWGKANLPPDQLQVVQRFLALEEQLSFRCGLAKLRVNLPQTEEGGEQEVDEKGNPVPAKAAPSGEAAAKAPAKAKQPVRAAKTKDAKGLEGAAAASAATKTKPKPQADKSKSGEAQTKPTAAATAKPRPKVDDAYRPPPSNASGGDPFAAQKTAPKQ